jgi:hypothetical protein
MPQRARWVIWPKVSFARTVARFGWYAGSAIVTSQYVDAPLPRGKRRRWELLPFDTPLFCQNASRQGIRRVILSAFSPAELDHIARGLRGWCRTNYLAEYGDKLLADTSS